MRDMCRKRRRHGDDELGAVLHRSVEVRNCNDSYSTWSPAWWLTQPKRARGTTRRSRHWPAVAFTPSPWLATRPPGNDRLVDVVRTGITATRSTQTRGEDSVPSETRRTEEHHW